MRVRIGWGVAASAAFHIVLLLGLAWSMRPQFHAPAAAPIEISLIPRRLVERRAAAEPPPLVRARPALRRDDIPRDTPRLDIPLAPAASAAGSPAPAVVPPGPAPVPAYRGLAGCSDDPGRATWQRPCFSGTSAETGAPHLRMADPREREWAAELARRRTRAQTIFRECPPGKPMENLGFGCID